MKLNCPLSLPLWVCPTHEKLKRDGKHTDSVRPVSVLPEDNSIQMNQITLRGGETTPKQAPKFEAVGAVLGFDCCQGVALELC